MSTKTNVLYLLLNVITLPNLASYVEKLSGNDISIKLFVKFVAKVLDKEREKLDIKFLVKLNCH